MDNKPQRPARSILSAWMLVIILVVSGVSALFTAILVYHRFTGIKEAADARLLMAAEMSREILGSDYHDRIEGPSSVSKAQFADIVWRNDDLCRRLGLQYLWSVLQIDNTRLVFTSATHSDVNNPASPCASFFETHRDPRAFKPAMGSEMKPSFSSFHNEWGAGRMVLIPRKDSRGRTYIFGASIQLAEYDAIIRQSVLAGLAIWLAVMSVAFPAALALSHRLTSPIAGLTEAADRMASGDLDAALPSDGTQELQSLSGSFDRMRRELKQQTEELRESEHRYRSLLSRLPIGVYRNTPGRSGRFIMANEAIAKMFGYESPEELIQTDVSDLYMNPEERETLSRQLNARDGVDGFVLHLKKKNGSPFWGSVTARVVRNDQGEIKYFDGIIEDITARQLAEEEKEKLQNQLLQAHKMESIGRLAGGVAHDFNNMLSIILGNIEMVLADLPDDSPLCARLEGIQAAALRSADITRQLLAFARRQTISPEVLDLNRTVESMLKMLGRLIGEDIDLSWHPGRSLWPVRVDPAQIDQILANLCVNARDAIVGVGKLTIKTDNVCIDQDEGAEHTELLPGEYVMLAVSDDGHGMDKETRRNLFEPFFTTKEMGKGTGLGLATVYGIVKQNKGFINVYSEPNEGTTFKIYLPRHILKLPSTSQKDTAKSAARGSETILLVEDEPAILEVTKMMLERQGYTVLAAATPAMAVRLAREHAGEIHLLMTDVVMPEMNGQDLSRNLLSTYPRIKCIFMSGYTANVIAHHGVLDKGVHFIQKPFSSLSNMANKVREVLDETKQGDSSIIIPVHKIQ